MKTYTYSVLRYTHSIVSGEQLNIGVLLYSPEERFAEAIIEKKYARLSRAFSSFDRQTYALMRESFFAALAMRKKALQKGELFSRERSARELAMSLWPGVHSTFQASEDSFGMTEDLTSSLHQLYDRFVASQTVTDLESRRQPVEVWQEFQKRLPLDLSREIQPREFSYKEFHQKFDHTYQNGSLHILEPVSFEYADKDGLLTAATTWRGKLDFLRPKLVGTHLYFLAGRPRPEHVAAASTATEILTAIEQLSVKVVPEKEFSSLANQLQQLPH